MGKPSVKSARAPSPYTKRHKREYDYSTMYSRLPENSALRQWRQRNPEAPTRR